MDEIYLVPVYPCPLERRLGAWGDGGKWLCEAHGKFPPSTIVYSIGSRAQTDFEEAIFKRYGLKAFTFDPSLNAKQMAFVKSRPFINFFPVGLGSPPPKNKDWKMVSFEGLLALNKHSYVDIFKLDCEGCEYEIVSKIAEKYTRERPPFGQLLMEIHGLSSIEKAVKLLTTLETLGYRMFHSEPNARYARGYEVAYIHESIVKPKIV